MNNDDIGYLSGEDISEEVSEEITTTSEEVSEESSEEVTTTSEEISEESSEENTTTSEEVPEEETTTLVNDNSDVIALLEEQNVLLSSTYDMQVFIFIVLLFILFRTYVLHIFDMIRSMGKE